MIYYLSPDYDEAAGGIRVLYRHVDALVKTGIQAAVLHSKRGFRCTWFSNTTPIVYAEDIQVNSTDFIVIPEIYFHLLGDLKISTRDKGRKILGHKLDYINAKSLWVSEAKKIVFNQNAYHTFLSFSDKIRFDPQFLKHVSGYLSISDQNKAYLEYAFPELPVYRVQWSLEPELYSFDLSLKKNIITYMPRKNADHSLQVLHILRSRGALKDFEVLPIQGLDQNGVSEMLKKSSIFLSFGYPEGLPLPPAEAMACGNIVVGYHGGGGVEYFKDEFSYQVPFGDIIGFCQTIEKVLLEFSTDKDRIHDKMKLASDFILNRYNSKNEEEILLSAWSQILNK